MQSKILGGVKHFLALVVHKKNILLFFLIGIIVNIYSQNLLNNGDFEIYNECPTKYLSRKKFLPFWFSPTLDGTPDYFNKCTRANANIPRNFAGVQNTISGVGYVGIIVVSFPSGYRREYIATEFTSKLEKDKRYCIKMYISLADYSKYAISQISVYFSKKKPDMLTKKILPYHPQVSFQKEYFDNMEDWIFLCDTYIAEGGEKYLVIGNFEDKYPLWPGAQKHVMYDYLKSKKMGMSGYKKSLIAETAYYYIDNVSLVEIEDQNECICHLNKSLDVDSIIPSNAVSAYENIKPGEIVVLQNVYFEFDKSELLTESYPELNKLVNYLHKNPEIHIEISGHTDNIGTVEYNQQLSEARAKAVVDYLTGKGIESNRLSYKGYGSSQPIADNSTEEGRAKNRRVELVVIEK